MNQVIRNSRTRLRNIYDSYSKELYEISIKIDKALEILEDTPTIKEKKSYYGKYFLILFTLIILIGVADFFFLNSLILNKLISLINA